MYKNKTFLAIIPARGGSKRLPNKNLLPLKGKPLIQWTIDAAKKSKYIDAITISSDNEQILDIANKNCLIAIKRPLFLSTDEANTSAAVLHVLESLDDRYDYLILLQPTSPLRKTEHIDKAIEFLFERNADAIISVCEAKHNPMWCNTLPEDLSMVDFINKHIKEKRSQDLPKYYELNGAIYIVKTERFFKEKTFFISDKVYAFIMDKFSSVDIDEEFDFKFAEFLAQTK